MVLFTNKIDRFEMSVGTNHITGSELLHLIVLDESLVSSLANYYKRNAEVLHIAFHGISKTTILRMISYIKAKL